MIEILVKLSMSQLELKKYLKTNFSSLSFWKFNKTYHITHIDGC
jgi:hypothetical protein